MTTPLDAAPVPSVRCRRAGWLVVAITLVVFAPTLGLGRVALDDFWLWSDDSPLRSPSLAVAHHVCCDFDARVRHDLGTEYLPVRDAVVAADMALWGGGERGPHATQLALYALTVLALGGLLVGFGMRCELAWLATLLWAIHPIHVESVAWLSERKGVLAGLFAIACGHAWIRYRRGGARGYLGLAVLAAVAATWSKAPAMFAPAVFAAWDALLLPAARRRWIAIAVVGAATAAAALPVVLVARDAGVLDSAVEVAPDARWRIALAAQGHYVESLVLARQPALSYPLQSTPAAPLEIAIGAAAVLGSAALAVWPRRPRAWRLSALAWAWLWFLPISQLVAAVHIAVADRYAYLWSFAGCLAVAWWVLKLRGALRLAIGGALVLALGIASVRAQAAWTTSRQLFARALDASPADPVAAERLADELTADGESSAALAVIDRSLARSLARGLAADPYLLERRAHLLDVMGRPGDALATADRAAQSGHASALALDAELLARAGRLDEALAQSEAAARRRPGSAAFARARIALLVQLGRLADADALARSLVARDPTVPSELLLAKVLLARGQIAEARACAAIADTLGASRHALDELHVPEAR